MVFTHTTIAVAMAGLLVSGTNAGRIGKRCTGTISSMSDVAAAIECTTININSFTVPGGETFTLDCATGTTVNVLGNITFGVSNWVGPLFEIEGTSVTFNGNGYTFDGNGPSYWDGLGGNGGVTKPKFMKVKNSGIFRNLKVLNAPVAAFSLGNDYPLTIDTITIDDSLGDQPNANSDGLPAGHNTDGFDVSTSNVVIQNSIVMNQDDCLAIGTGTNITFQNNKCSGGHGISIGSVNSNAVIKTVNILNNAVSDSANCLRIKTDAVATNATVTGVTYTGNTCTTITGYGVLIDESYPAVLGTPGTGVVISDVTFTSGNTVSVDLTAYRVEVNCGVGGCSGTWNWSGLTATGGKTGVINYSGITGFNNSGTASTTSTTKTTTTATTTTTSAASSGTGTPVADYGQCGGIGYTGSTTCVSPYVCTYSNAYYSQCL